MWPCYYKRLWWQWSQSGWAKIPWLSAGLFSWPRLWPCSCGFSLVAMGEVALWHLPVLAPALALLSPCLLPIVARAPLILEAKESSVLSSCVSLGVALISTAFFWALQSLHEGTALGLSSLSSLLATFHWVLYQCVLAPLVIVSCLFARPHWRACQLPALHVCVLCRCSHPIWLHWWVVLLDCFAVPIVCTPCVFWLARVDGWPLFT